MGGDCCCGRDRSSGGSGTRVQDHGSALQVESSKDDTEGGEEPGGRPIQAQSPLRSSSRVYK